MKITDVRITLAEKSEGQLKAFCSITIDDEFVVHELKVIEAKDRLFVSMPARKAHTHCGPCGTKTNLLNNYCHQCGAKMPVPQIPTREDGGGKLYLDICHPITHECRAEIHAAVTAAYRLALEERAKEQESTTIA